MTFLDYLEEKITALLFHIFFLALVLFLLFFFGADSIYIILTAFVYIVFNLLYMYFCYRKITAENTKITALMHNLSEAYYIADVLPKPKSLENAAYYEALKKACKAMNDKIGKLEEEKQDYEDYVESFAHEIKIPIGALSLTFDNTKNFVLKEESDKILWLVEQMLYYARSQSPEKDYFICPLKLDELCHRALLKFRRPLMEAKVTVDIRNVDYTVFTDEKWMTFILSQLIQNALKYFDKKEKRLTIFSEDLPEHTILIIEDNGCGISASELPRLFDKGFTGNNRQKNSSTGMGLYLAKKLCARLGLSIEVSSVPKEYTRFLIYFPKGSLHRLDNGD